MRFKGDLLCSFFLLLKIHYSSFDHFTVPQKPFLSHTLYSGFLSLITNMIYMYDPVKAILHVH